jgi:hypothetical protein
MNKKHLTLLTFLVLFLTVPGLEAVVWINNVCDPFPGGKASGDSGDIESLVTEGAALYFKANADIMNLCAESEITPNKDYNFSRSLSLVQSALGNLKEAKAKYLQAVQMGIAAGYIQEKLDLLKTFDYDGFAAQQELNETIKDSVKGFLKNGDVTGFYQEAADQLEELMVILKDIEKSLQNNLKPKVPTLWHLVQKLSQLTLFGNYGTVMGQTAFGH